LNGSKTHKSAIVVNDAGRVDPAIVAEFRPTTDRRP